MTDRQRPPADAEPDVFPASLAQERMWFVTRLQPDLAIYNLSLWIPLPPGCDGERAWRALLRVVARHESLRTSFSLADGGRAHVLQRVHPAVPAGLAETDLQGLPPADREPEFERIARADAGQPFDLDRPPLWRARLVQLTDDDVRLVWICHHTIFDGASSDIFVRELQECVESIGEQREPRLAELPIQYADYAVWQRGQLTGERAAAEAAYWRTALARLPADLGLPADRPRPAVRSYRGEVFQFALSEALTARVEDWSRRAGMTPFMTLLSAFKVLLARWAGQPDIYVGCPLGARTLPELAPLIGMFVNAVVIRTNLGGDPSFQEVARRVRAGVLESLEHQEWPGRTPAYQVSFNLVPSDTRGQIHNGTVMVDLALDLNLRDRRLHGRIEYATDVFEAATVEHLAGAYASLLDAALGDPDRPVSWLAAPTVLPAGVEWLDGGPLPTAPRPVPTCVADQARHRPDQVAIVYNGQTMRYADLHLAAAGLAAHLVELGASPQRPVAVALPRGTDAVVAILAALYAGAPYVAVDPDGPRARAETILADADPLVVVARPVDAVLARGRHLVSPGVAGRSGPLAPCTGHHPAYVSYTSGSTGRPNGVLVDHAALAHFVAGATARYGVTAGDRVLQFAPLDFDASVEELFVTLCAGATLVLRSDEMLESVPRLLAACEDLGVTVLDLPTAYWHELAYAVGTGVGRLPACVRTVIIGGEAASPARVAQWHAAVPARVRLLNTYGPTEATVVATAADLTGEEPGVPIGTPLPGVRAAIVNGELYLAGGGLALGYLNRPELTARRFVTVEGERAYRTGDLVRLRADGQLEFAGRADHELKISGHRVDPAEVESVLLAHPAVRDAAVTGTAAGTGAKRLVAYVVPAGPDPLQPHVLRRHAAGALPAAVVPASFVAVPQIPRTASGKVDRAALRDRDSNGPTAAAPRDDRERLVLDVWTEVLGTRPASIDDDFFDLGGQSLQTIQVATRLTAALGREVAVATVFQHPTAAGLAAALDHGTDAADDQHRRDTVLPPDVRPGPPPARTAAQAKTVLLTGATGFVGRYLLRELLAATDVRVVCPVRAASPRAAAERVARALADAGGPAAGLAGRVRAIPANLARPALGLEPAVFDALADEIDAIYHAAAVVSLARSYASVRATNVLATGEVLRLAAAGRPSAMHHISTVAVAPFDDVADAHPGGRDGYRLSKWVAERLVAEAGRRGLPVAAYRLGRVAGPSDGTAVNPDDLIWRILRASVAVSALPDLDVAEPWTPVDWVARTVVSLSRASGGRAGGSVHSLVPAAPTRLREVFDWVAEYGFSLPRLPVAEWTDAIGRHDEHAAAAVPLGAAPTVHIGGSSPVGGDCPPVDRALVHRYLAAAVSSGLLPSPTAPSASQ